VLDDPTRFQRPVSSAMTKNIETIAPEGQIADLYRIFDRGYVAVVMEKGKFLGLITRVDLLNNLRRKLP
jgi:cystathionine beta-synthase